LKFRLKIHKNQRMILGKFQSSSRPGTWCTRALVLKFNLVATHLLCLNSGALIESNVRNSGPATHHLRTPVLEDSSFQRKTIIKEWDGVKTKDFKFFYISAHLGPDFSWFY
jgi:hypothetical protein